MVCVHLSARRGWSPDVSRWVNIIAVPSQQAVGKFLIALNEWFQVAVETCYEYEENADGGPLVPAFHENTKAIVGFCREWLPGIDTSQILHMELSVQAVAERTLPLECRRDTEFLPTVNNFREPLNRCMHLRDDAKERCRSLFPHGKPLKDFTKNELKRIFRDEDFRTTKNRFVEAVSKPS
jgi:hypothetical protein